MISDRLEPILKPVLERIEKPLADLGYTISLNTEHDCLDITRIDAPEFCASIGGYLSPLKARYSPMVEICRYRQGKERKNLYGQSLEPIEYNWISDRYKFDEILSYTTLESLGLKKVDYRMSIYQLSREFKPDKSAKLILNDLLPVLAINLAIYRESYPIILAKIEREAKCIKLLNQVQALSKYPNNSHDVAGECSFEVNGRRITVMQDCKIIETIRKEITLADLIK